MDDHDLTPPRFAVIGTGRCGTGYTAALLKANGHNVGHEKWWRAGLPGQQSGLDGDVSWLALPDIETGDWSGSVAHIVRHPQRVVESLVGTRFFHPTERESPFVQFAYTHMPGLPDNDPVEAAVEWWVQWNRRCAAVADVTLRVEDLRTPEACASLTRALDVCVVPQPGISTKTNHRRISPVSRQRVAKLVAGRAKTFGYPL